MLHSSNDISVKLRILQQLLDKNNWKKRPEKPTKIKGYHIRKIYDFFSEKDCFYFEFILVKNPHLDSSYLYSALRLANFISNGKNARRTISDINPYKIKVSVHHFEYRASSVILKFTVIKEAGVILDTNLKSSILEFLNKYIKSMRYVKELCTQGDFNSIWPKINFYSNYVDQTRKEIALFERSIHCGTDEALSYYKNRPEFMSLLGLLKPSFWQEAMKLKEVREVRIYNDWEHSSVLCRNNSFIKGPREVILR